MSASIREIKDKHKNRLLALPGVVSIGIGRDPDGKPVIVIGLDSQRPETFAKLPKILEGYPVRSQIMGSVKAR